MIHRVIKQFKDFPAAHRQPKHDGHCSLIHGHNWSFDIVFTCQILDKCGFVIDVGRLQPLKDFLTTTFDHTLLLNHEDPMVSAKDGFFDKLSSSYANIVLVPNCGMEGLSRLVFEQGNYVLRESFAQDVAERGLMIVEVTCWEDSKNSATYL